MNERTEGAIRTVAIAAMLMLVTGYFSYSFGHRAGVNEAPEIAEQRREEAERADAALAAFWDRMGTEPTSAEECLDILRAELGLPPEQRVLEYPDPFDNSMGFSID